MYTTHTLLGDLSLEINHKYGFSSSRADDRVAKIMQNSFNITKRQWNKQNF
uniref:Uncharacterized protein n=1 Tax=Siphoviridae sp. cthu813 TaxID=2825618 RepID=A0A8S5VHY5_9CAUD|nr:MAG TPA: hypothetical protein [Siphoviridae sp. cthu813]